MKIIVADHYEDLCKLSAVIIKECVQAKKDAVLGLATGSTPVGLYKQLISDYQAGEIDFSKVITFNLDEYAGLSPSHPQSYNKFMHEHLFQHINVQPDHIHIPQGDNPQLEAECKVYEELIRQAGGIDVQILGIGSNGHIGFNEPGSDFEERTRIVRLSESTIQANARFFGGDPVLVPRLAVSMGIKTIMEFSKHIVLLANGEEKADAIQKMAEGPVTPEIPASILQQHNHVTVIADPKAAQKLKNLSYLSNK
ncbi:glucosamine-6-phosphate deaminase [Bacillus mojavensis]|jgi:glucosamine-6-phosphate deaminase|uniref:Glucosamine-6-phosphate deaminase n=1 Tax=Bacillus mojavensis TaxID=72360 RepID=A0ABX6LW37_BACMO|nr:glucosamine-6-phosphate deaminase [Bacillus mojavensis]MCY9093144.1 glucosamine-6-phosphate deaminase [Bacillus mojavensis]MCY9188923.1 glucosamine-6-phosphate deaminase [Bacillus mojavensis]MEC1754566.1 glucosamine-6-phosphate deaminase [Bacillus mojavensis]MEC1800713.1 glucosamine-6-phosphate deaminase [Bacillus mojavensis]QJC94783.1 Glucosamine-6-phosphate deaminase [Bacillus mojavensis]